MTVKVLCCEYRGTKVDGADSSRQIAVAPLNRRTAVCLLGTLVGFSGARSPLAIAKEAEEDALYSVGEQYNNLNACALNTQSCVSTQNDDEKHFIPPWTFDGPMTAAKDKLIKVATGGAYESYELIDGVGGLAGLSRADAAAYIVDGFTAKVRGRGAPNRPQRQRMLSTVQFDGRLADSHTTADGSEYVHLVFGEGSLDPSDVIDAEFLLLSDDNIVDIRATARGRPGLRDSAIGLSFSDGLAYDRNTAKRKTELLRKALQWEAAPVVTDFDVRFNSKRLLWFEKLFQPFLSGTYKTEEEPLYDK